MKKGRSILRPALVFFILWGIGLFGTPVGAEEHLSAKEAYKRGQEAEKKKEYKAAMKYYMTAVDLGYIPAESAVGGLYAAGGKKYRDKAVEWFRRAAEHDDPRGQNAMGFMYSKGIGVPLDLEQSKYWYRLAVKHGSKVAKEHLKELSPDEDAAPASMPDAGPRDVYAENNLINLERWNKECNPHYLQGLKGKFRVLLNSYYRYKPEHDPEILARKDVIYIRQKISDLAASDPNGPQFEFVDARPADLMLNFSMDGRHPDSEGRYTAYWADVDCNNIKGINSSGWAYLFRFATAPYDSDEVDTSGAGFWTRSINEGIQKWYDYVAHGWSCN